MTRLSHLARWWDAEHMLQIQTIVLELDGITAADYLAHFRDADPALEATRLRSITIDAAPLDDTVVAVLHWVGNPPAARVAATTAGFHLTGDVVRVRSHVLPAERRVARAGRPTLAVAAAV